MSLAPWDDRAASRARFAALLRNQRMTAGLTQRELAGLAGIGVRTVRELERARVHRPQQGTLELLAEALELTGSARDAFIATLRPGNVWVGGRPVGQ